MDEFIVVVREQEFPLDVEQRIPQADVILLREALFPDIPVEALCVVVGRIAVKEAHRAVIVPDKPFKILVLHHHLCQAAVGLLDERKRSPHILGPTSEAGQGGAIGLPDPLIKPCCPLCLRSDIRILQQLPYTVKILPGIEYIPEMADQLVGLFPNPPIEVHKKAVIVVIDLEVIAGILVKEHPAGPSEDLDVPLVEDGEHGYDLLPQRPLAADPGHKGVQGPPSGLPKSSRAASKPWMEASMPMRSFSICRMVA